VQKRRRNAHVRPKVENTTNNERAIEAIMLHTFHTRADGAANFSSHELTPTVKVHPVVQIMHKVSISTPLSLYANTWILQKPKEKTSRSPRRH
jgi:hypothetical protein